jgi:hypothetical protein
LWRLLVALLPVGLLLLLRLLLLVACQAGGDVVPGYA